MQRSVDHDTIDRIKHYYAGGIHAQLRGGVDPVTTKTLVAQPAKHLFGVIGTLTGDDNVHLAQKAKVISVIKLHGPLTQIWPLGTALRCGKKDRFAMVEVPFRHETAHQHRSDHAAPADETHFFGHDSAPFSSPLAYFF